VLGLKEGIKLDYVQVTLLAVDAFCLSQISRQWNINMSGSIARFTKICAAKVLK
jgi:hypothetical protein